MLPLGMMSFLIINLTGFQNRFGSYIFLALVLQFLADGELLILQSQAKVGNVLENLFAHDVQLRDGVTAEIMTFFSNLD
jgi:hypothetical protein